MKMSPLNVVAIRLWLKRTLSIQRMPVYVMGRHTKNDAVHRKAV
jgi:hypothetical protein